MDAQDDREGRITLAASSAVRRSVRAALVVLAVAALAVATPAAGATAPAAGNGRHRAAPPPELALGAHLLAVPGAQVAMPPVGLSMEYPVMAADLGPGACPPPALTAELQRLASPPLELGGQTQDFTVPPGVVAGSPASWEGLSAYPLPGGFWTTMRCLLAATHQPLTVGLNARSGAPAWAEQMVAGAQTAATSGLGFSLGNEPDLYYLPDYASLAKPQAAEEGIAVGRYLQVAAALRPAIGAAPLTGPELSRPERWQASLPRVIATLREQTVGVHMYPLSVCRTPRTATIHGLLSTQVGDAPHRLAWVVSEAAAAGAGAILSEANSVSCGGKPGVSDGRAAAVWAVRFVLSALRTGFREVRFHFSGDPYDPFYVRGGEVVRRPIEAAMAALNQWLAVGSTVRTVRGVPGLTATVVSAPARSLLILDNESGRPAAVVLRGATVLHAEGFSAAGPPGAILRGGSRVRAVLPANSVLAISFHA
jgi:hypothetical protein